MYDKLLYVPQNNTHTHETTHNMTQTAPILNASGTEVGFARLCSLLPPIICSLNTTTAMVGALCASNAVEGPAGHSGLQQCPTAVQGGLIFSAAGEPQK